MLVKNWWVYMVCCSDDSLYTGITTDLKRRVSEHNHGPKGAKYTKARRPVKLVWSSKVGSRSQAQQLEYKLRQLSRAQKHALLE